MNPWPFLIMLQQWFQWRRWGTPALLQGHICFTWYILIVWWEYVDALSLSYVIDVYKLQYLFLKASYYGVCSWSKCTHVHYPQADHGCFHNGCGVSSGRTKIYIFSCWKVRSAAATCIYVCFSTCTFLLKI